MVRWGEGMQFYEMTGFVDNPEDLAKPISARDLPDPSRAALLLDFDGTLVDIAERPDGVVVTPEAGALVSRAMERLDGRVAFVSGRTIDDLERFLPGFDGALIGAHGAMLRIEGHREQAEEYDEELVTQLTRLATDFAGLRPEFLVEPKPSGVVLHFRQAQEHAALALRFMESLAMAADGFKLQPAHMAYELKPEKAGKDVALRRLLSAPPFEGAIPVFAGDDLTDEPPLELVQEMGGLGIKIGTAETVARHRLPDPAALIRCLGEWLD